MEGIPISFTQRLARTPGAVRVFSALSADKQREMVSRFNSISSKDDMDALIAGMMQYDIN